MLLFIFQILDENYYIDYIIKSAAAIDCKFQKPSKDLEAVLSKYSFRSLFYVFNPSDNVGFICKKLFAVEFNIQSAVNFGAFTFFCEIF